jgi:hypothetical protein
MKIPVLPLTKGELEGVRRTCVYTVALTKGELEGVGKTCVHTVAFAIRPISSTITFLFMYDITCRFLAESFSADFASWLLGEPTTLTDTIRRWHNLSLGAEGHYARVYGLPLNPGRG